jgi:hypothetical protein
VHSDFPNARYFPPNLVRNACSPPQSQLFSLALKRIPPSWDESSFVFTASTFCRPRSLSGNCHVISSLSDSLPLNYYSFHLSGFHHTIVRPPFLSRFILHYYLNCVSFIITSIYLLCSLCLNFFCLFRFLFFLLTALCTFFYLFPFYEK